MSFGRLASLVRERGDLFSRMLLGIAQVAAIAWFSPGRGLPLDDAWIHQVVARTFAETGTLGYAPGQHGAAATSYLWAALLAIDFKVLHLDPSRWALVLNGLAALTTGQLLASLLVRARPERVDSATWRAISLVITGLACISPNVLWLVCSGMEAMPFVALSLTAIWAATDEKHRSRRALVAGAAAGALALLRPEAAPLGGILAAHALLRRRARDLVPIAGPWLAALALYVGSNVAKTGHALPSTMSGRRWLWFEMSAGLSRSDRVFDFLDAWATRLGSYTFDTSFGVTWILVALAAYGALCLANVQARADEQKDGARLLVAWALCHAAFYALLLPTPGHGGRYQPFTPLLFAACLPLGATFVLGELAGLIGFGAKVRFGWLSLGGIAPFIALAAPVAGSLRDANVLAVAHIQATEIAAGAFINELPEGVVASFDIGGSGYTAKRRVLDLGGLSDPSTASLLEGGRIATWLEDNHVRWIVLPQALETVLPVFDDYRARLHLLDNPALRIEPIRVFETPFDKWEPAIRATWNAAPRQVVYEVRYTGQPGVPEVPLVAQNALRSVADPASLVPRHERIVAEHMLATLAAWGLPVDVRVTPAAPSGDADKSASVPASANGCGVSLGWWGFRVEGCSGVGEPARVQAMAYELAGRYVDAGDLGGALRAIPHVIAKAKRRSDPRFLPPIAPLMPPTAGGLSAPPLSASSGGLVVLSAMLLAAIGLEALATRRERVSRLFGFARAKAADVAAAAVAILACGSILAVASGCGRSDTDVSRAIAHGRGAVEIAIENGGSVNPTESHRAPLLEAAVVGDPAIVSLLLSRGARLDVQAPDGASPLHLAARHGRHAALTVLAAATKAGCGHCAPDRKELSAKLDAGAGLRRRTALQDAVTSGSVGSVSALLDAGADPKSGDAFGQTSLHLAATIDPWRSAEMAGLLLSAGADPFAADARGWNALHAAAATDNVPLVNTLLNLRPRLVEEKTLGGETALELALRYGRDRAADALLRAGALLTGDDVWPPLHDAARTDALERAATLLASGADVRSRVRNKTALDVAIAHGSKRVEALLRDRLR